MMVSMVVVMDDSVDGGGVDDGVDGGGVNGGDDG